MGRVMPGCRGLCRRGRPRRLRIVVESVEVNQARDEARLRMAR